MDFITAHNKLKELREEQKRKYREYRFRQKLVKNKSLLDKW